MRSVAVALAAGVALAAAPSALAWTTLTGGVNNTVIPSMLVTRAGTELVSFESPQGDTISVARAGGAPKVVVSGDPIAGRTALVQLPTGAIELYYPDAAGVARLESTDDGQSWSAPVQTQSHDLAGVNSATVGPDGTPYFTQDNTAGVFVYRGLDGETSANVFPRCCGYAESIAVDQSGLVQVAFYSNADSTGKFLVEQLDGSLDVAATVEFDTTAPRDDDVPLVADAQGYTYLGWAPGYPTATAFAVVPFTHGAKQATGMSASAQFTGGDPHMALSVDPSGRLWGVWTGGGAVHATRSRSHAAHTGAFVGAAVSGTAYDVAAVGLPSGNVDVIVNTGSSLVEQQLQPGLTVRTFDTAKKVGKKTVVTHWAQALDDGFGVPSATFTVGGKTVHADASGKAKVAAGAGSAKAPGYVGASFHTK